MSNKRKLSNSKENRESIKIRKNDDTINYSNNAIPNEILLRIFEYLPIKDLCQTAMVCKTWKKVAYDCTLWYHIDLSKINLSLKHLWKFIRQRYTTYARSITINGLNNKEFKGKLDKIISPAFMQKFKISCPHLMEVNLKFIDLNSIIVTDLPDNIEKLQSFRCEVPLNWFSNNNFKNLQSLDLTNSARICTTHIKDLVKNCKDTLTKLILTNCYRINDTSIDVLTSEFLKIEILKINGTKCTSLSIHWICNRMKFIELLDIRDCQSIINSDIQFINETFGKNSNFRLNS